MEFSTTTRGLDPPPPCYDCGSTQSVWWQIGPAGLAVPLCQPCRENSPVFGAVEEVYAYRVRQRKEDSEQDESEGGLLVVVAFLFLAVIGIAFWAFVLVGANG